MNESPQEIRQKTFSVTRRGYDRAEVASYLAALAADPSGSDPDEIRRKTFSVTRRGYDKAEVVTYLARLAHDLEQEAPGSEDPVAEDTSGDSDDQDAGDDRDD